MSHMVLPPPNDFTSKEAAAFDRSWSLGRPGRLRTGGDLYYSSSPSI